MSHRIVLCSEEGDILFSGYSQLRAAPPSEPPAVAPAEEPEEPPSRSGIFRSAERAKTGT